jgi:ATP phosphoribosyltransferase
MNLANTDKIKFALPTKGRLKDPAIDLMKRAGYSFRTSGRNLYATCTNAEIIFIFVRADDIPVLVEKGVVDAGITGGDLVRERSADVTELMSLGFGKCRLCVAVHDNVDSGDFNWLQGKNIATSFPTITKDYFNDKGIDITAIDMNGSVEVMIALNLASAIVDLVETGDSLRDNNLKVFSEILNSEAMLIANNNKAESDDIKNIKRRMEGILVASQYSILEYNIPLDKLHETESITPGYKSPTVSKLEDPQWVAVKVMVKKKEVVQAMDLLEKAGATAILETTLSNCRL